MTPEDFFPNQRVRTERGELLDEAYGDVTEVGYNYIKVLWDGEKEVSTYWGDEVKDIRNIFQSKK